MANARPFVCWAATEAHESPPANRQKGLVLKTRSPMSTASSALSTMLYRTRRLLTAAKTTVDSKLIPPMTMMLIV